VRMNLQILNFQITVLDIWLINKHNNFKGRVLTEDE
jgi:hypothetical protein